MKNNTPASALTNLSGRITCRVIGVGGIGQIVATYLVRYLVGLAVTARVVLIDGDEFEHGNETRMSVRRFFQNKAAALADTLGAACRGTQVTVLPVQEYVRTDNLDRVIHSGPGESVLLCVDNHATRKLVGDHCERLDDVCLVSGGNDGVGPDSSGYVRQGTAGNVQVLMRRDGRNLTCGLSDLHPEIATPQDVVPDDAGCDLSFSSSPQILFTNLTAAGCMLNTWWLYARGELHYSELVFDISKGRTAPLIEIPTESSAVSARARACSRGSDRPGKAAAGTPHRSSQ